MKICTSCNAESPQLAAYCVGCGKELPLMVTDQPAEVAVTAHFENPRIDTEEKPTMKLRFFKRPLTSDWTIWLWLIFAGIGGTRSLYRDGQRSHIASAAASVFDPIMTLLFTLPFSFFVFAFLPALVRRLVWKLRSKRGQYPNTGSGKAITKSFIMLLIAVIAAGFIGYYSGLGSSPTSGTLNQQSNSSLMVNLSFNDLQTAMKDYTSVKIDPSNPLGNFNQVAAAFDKVETNYIELKGALSAISSQDQLSTGAPKLAEMNLFVQALGPYVESHTNYQDVVKVCLSSGSTSSQLDCTSSAFDKWESQLVRTTDTVAKAYSAMMKTIPSN